MKTPSHAKALTAVASLLCAAATAETSALWEQFKQAKENGTEPVLPDFSYAGYDYSESHLPDTSTWQVFSVTDYGAVADDANYDDAAIQSTIDAAEAAGGGVVFFPPGRFMVSPNNDITQVISIEGSNILLKGSGSGAGGTEIFMDQMKVNNGRYMFEFSPPSTSETVLTTVSADAPRESLVVEVADASALSPGQRILLRGQSVGYAHAYYAPLTLDSAWTRLVDTEGFKINEIHTIASIDGNTITLREPLHLPLITSAVTIEVRSYQVISNVGGEGIRFKGNWDSYPETFVHHKDDIHDYAWNAMRFDNVADGWLRDCDFKDWNQGVYFDGCASFTVGNISFTGKMGHMSIHTRRSYGILIKDCVDTAGHWHGPGLGYWGCGTVYLRHQMAGNQQIDSHSGSPYANLMDQVSGGNFDRNGGPHASYPHHGKHFVAWNFTVSGGPDSYDFWPSSRNGHTFAEPIFCGLQGKSISMAGQGYNESPGTAVEPASLFEAQLAYRIAPRTETLAASALSEGAATLNGTLISSGKSEASARIYWGTSDGGKEMNAWDAFEDLGATSPGPISASVSGLVPGQRYYFRVWANNSHGEAWSPQAQSFVTEGPPSVTATGVGIVDENSATLKGLLLSGQAADVTVVWDLEDRGNASLANWPVANRTTVSGQLAGSFSVSATGLAANQNYVYRIVASNLEGQDWSEAVSFKTPLNAQTAIQQGDDDYLAFEAEIVADAGEIVDFDNDGKAWSVVTGVSGANGDVIESTNHGTSGFAAFQSIAKYRMIFQSAGTYRFYSRGRGVSSAQNSFHQSTAWNRMGPLDVFDTSDNGSWQWMQNATMVVAPEQVGRMLTLNLHTREPGTQLDRIVLHKTSSLDGAQLDGLFDAPSGVVARDRLELFREDFETDGAGVRYTVSGPNAGSKWLRTNGTALAQLGAPAGDGGSWYFGGKGLGAEHALVFDTAVDADAYQDLQLSLDMANGDEGFELGEYLKVEVRHGDGAWNELVSYRPAADAQKLAEGGLIPANDQGQPSSDDMRRFGSYLIPAGGGGLSLRITAFCDSDAEQLAVDNLRIHGTPRPDDFDTWSAANIADPSLRGFADDADGDGIPNGLEAFLGTNPIVASPGIGGLSASGSGILSFSHPYNTTVPGWISATYQWSPNLRDWYASGQGPSGQPKVTVEALRSSGISSVTATASEAMNQYFIRLRVSGN